jgi:lysyl-tRNA synthetase class 1
MKKTQSKQSLHWVDQVVNEIIDWAVEQHLTVFHVDDMKTPSGRVHTGALRGVVLHDLIAQVLEKKGDKPVKSTYVINDMDPMDGLPAYLDSAQYTQHMGKPLFQIPAPELEQSGIDFSQTPELDKKRYQQASNFAQFYALDYIDAFRQLGCSQQIVWSHELYSSGLMNELIKFVLDKVDEVKSVYQRVANYQLPAKWYPFQVICPKCGKIGTTLVTDWDGEQVEFECLVNQVEWAQGCGYRGKVSPFNGTGKLLWKVDWPAHWQAMGVNIEGAGKDHTSEGGSRDIANALLTEVFAGLVPFDIPYEWILIRGAKMSSSKGVGTSAREFVKLFPPQVGRFLFTSRRYGSVIDFDPTTTSIPDLFDQYDQGARIYWREEEGDERLARSFELAQIDSIPQAYFLPRFRDIVIWMQDPKINLEEKFEEIKGSNLTTQEKLELANRQNHARLWLDCYAPTVYKLTVVKELPEQVHTFDDQQKQFLQALEKLVGSRDWQPAELQQSIYELAKSSLGAKKGFQTIYLAFLGKIAGPKAAWLLLDIGSEVRHNRIQQILDISK